ncbi:MAG: hypothetical protein Q9201_005330, partial [Fulgogasparrea decipioides]
MPSPSPHHPSAMHISPLIHTTHAFISAFVSGRSPPSEVLDAYFAPDAEIHEHGPEGARSRLPFLAKTFKGRRSLSSGGHECEGTLDDYYRLLGETLALKPLADTVPELEAFSVDEEKGVVTVG